MNEHQPAEHTYNLERLIFFSDGVFAIVITLLVIELRPPSHWDYTFSNLLQSEWRALAAYVFSFITVGAYWNLHRRVFRPIARFHPRLVLFNLLLLLLVVLIPFGSELVAEGSRQEPLVIFLSLLIAVGIAIVLLWSFAAFFSDVVDPALKRAGRFNMLANLLVAPLLLGVVLLWTICGSSTIWLLPIFIPILLLRWALKRLPVVRADARS